MNKSTVCIDETGTFPIGILELQELSIVTVPPQCQKIDLAGNLVCTAALAINGQAQGSMQTLCVFPDDRLFHIHDG